MFDWLCEGRSSVYAVLALAGVGLLVLWWQTRRRGFLLALSAVGLLAVFHLLLDHFVETDHEQVVRKLQEMAAGVKSQNVDAIVRHISDRFQNDAMDKAQLRGYIEQAFQRRWVSDLSVWDFSFPPPTGTTKPGGLMLVQFFAKPTGNIATNTPHFLCKAHFIRDTDGQWRMHDFQVFNPFVDTNAPLHLPGM